MIVTSDCPLLLPVLNEKFGIPLVKAERLQVLLGKVMLRLVNP
jgi:hypothetical protein